MVDLYTDFQFLTQKQALMLLGLVALVSFGLMDYEIKKKAKTFKSRLHS